MQNYLDDLFTPTVIAVQQQKGSAGMYAVDTDGPDALDDDEIAHISASDSFYLATISESGWPYTQHKGGEAGFVKVLGPHTIGWAERSGNRQYLGAGNVVADSRVSAIFVDYPTRTRLKLRGHATYHPDPSPELVEALGANGIRIDGGVTVDVVATAWNCPKYITPRYTAASIEAATAPLRDRIAELEARIAAS
jgi:uncharacterized protein